MIKVGYGELPFGCKPSVLLLAHHDHDGDKKVKAIATGFLAVVDPYLVLITAAHAFDDWSPEKMFVKGDIGWVPLPVGKLELSKTDDIAVLFFESDDLSGVIDGSLCVQAGTDLAATGSAIDAIFQMHGFPGSKSKYSPIRNWRQELITVSLGVERSVPKRSTFHGSQVIPLCFELDLKDMCSDDGRPSNVLGKLDGMSGSPVIRHPVNSTGISDGVIAGMFVEWCEETKTAVVVPWRNIENFVRVAAEI